MTDKELRATDLMVGDWVLYKGELHQIVDIDRFSTMVESKTTIDSRADFDEIEPIPLTAEILEKNGFKKTQIHGEKQDDIFQCFNGEIIIEVGVYDPNFILIHYRYETPDGINSGELSSIVKVDGGKFYLHELQHTLRLCGIEKTIEL